jgi:hypothetical protein
MPQRKSDGGYGVAIELRGGSAVRFASADAVPGPSAVDVRLSRWRDDSGGLVRKILVKDVGLDEEEARKLL